MISQTTLAAGASCNPTALDKCKKALSDADVVIKKQSELLLTISNQTESVRDENEELSKALVTLKSELDSAESQKWNYGLIGITAGLVAASLLYMQVGK